MTEFGSLLNESLEISRSQGCPGIEFAAVHAQDGGDVAVSAAVTTAPIRVGGQGGIFASLAPWLVNEAGGRLGSGLVHHGKVPRREVRRASVPVKSWQMVGIRLPLIIAGMKKKATKSAIYKRHSGSFCISRSRARTAARSSPMVAWCLRKRWRTANKARQRVFQIMRVPDVRGLV